MYYVWISFIVELIRSYFAFCDYFILVFVSCFSRHLLAVVPILSAYCKEINSDHNYSYQASWQGNVSCKSYRVFSLASKPLYYEVPVVLKRDLAKAGWSSSSWSTRWKLKAEAKYKRRNSRDLIVANH